MSAPNSARQRNLHARGNGGAPPIPGARRPLTATPPAQARGWKDSADAARLIEGIPAAVPALDHRLPELRGGDARTDTPVTAPSPAACRPQARSAAAAVALMTGTIGLDPDVPTGRNHFRPTGPLPVVALTVSGKRLDITINSGGRVESVTAPAELIVEQQAALRS
jgi:hypothetical protein